MDELQGLEDQLMGLGATPIQAAKLAAAARAAAFKSVMSPGQKHFMAKVATMKNQEEAANIKNGSVTMEDIVFYQRVLLTASADNNLINDNSKDVEGIGNLTQGEIPKGTNFSLTKIRLAYANHATQTDASLVIYDNYGTIPVAVLNGRLQIKDSSKGGRVIVDLPATNFFAQGSTANRTEIPGFNDFVNLKSYKFIEGSTKLKVGLLFAGALAANNNFIEVQLAGPGTRSL
jgi:hypothetical protein